jgi:hypothetical protein
MIFSVKSKIPMAFLKSAGKRKISEPKFADIPPSIVFVCVSPLKTLVLGFRGEAF